MLKTPAMFSMAVAKLPGMSSGTVLHPDFACEGNPSGGPGCTALARSRHTAPTNKFAAGPPATVTAQRQALAVPRGKAKAT